MAPRPGKTKDQSAEEQPQTKVSVDHSKDKDQEPSLSSSQKSLNRRSLSQQAVARVNSLIKGNSTKSIASPLVAPPNWPLPPTPEAPATEQFAATSAFPQLPETSRASLSLTATLEEQLSKFDLGTRSIAGSTASGRKRLSSSTSQKRLPPAPVTEASAPPATATATAITTATPTQANLEGPAASTTTTTATDAAKEQAVAIPKEGSLTSGAASTDPEIDKKMAPFSEAAKEDNRFGESSLIGLGDTVGTTKGALRNGTKVSPSNGNGKVADPTSQRFSSTSQGYDTDQTFGPSNERGTNTQPSGLPGGGSNGASRDDATPSNYRPFRPHEEVSTDSNLARLAKRIDEVAIAADQATAEEEEESQGSLDSEDEEEDRSADNRPIGGPPPTWRSGSVATRSYEPQTKAGDLSRFPPPVQTGQIPVDRLNRNSSMDPRNPPEVDHGNLGPKTPPLKERQPFEGFRPAPGVLPRRYRKSDMGDDIDARSAKSGRSQIRGSETDERGNVSANGRNGNGAHYAEPSENSDAGSIYKPSAAKSSLADWAPNAEPVRNQNFGISNLPEWSTLKENEPTSAPIVNVQRDMDWSLRRLMSEKVFEELINDFMGRHRFREYLAQMEGTEHKLDMYHDIVSFDKVVKHLKATSEALHDVYLANDSVSHVDLPAQNSIQLYETLKTAFDLPASTEHIQNHLLRDLYHNEFQRFIKKQLVEASKIRLGKIELDEGERDGLGDCFCLSNPRLRENPIVLVSDGFVAVTGYPRQAIIGRNCRFLQGPNTAPEAIQRIRDALNKGEGCTELLLNYRRDGQPFWCLLNIVPLRDSAGRLVYFIGGQTNVTGTLVKSKGLSFLIGGGSVSDTAAEQKDARLNGFEVSPIMARYLSDLKQDGASRQDLIKHGGNKGKPASDTSSVRNSNSGSRRAAGAVDPESFAMNLDVLRSNGNSKKGVMSKFFNRSKARYSNNVMTGGQQQILGAEANLRREAYTLSEQIEYFSDVYSKILIFKKAKREIIFVTRELLQFFGLPSSTPKDLYNSPLIHADLVSLLCGSDNNETKGIRNSVKSAVKAGHEFSVMAGIRSVRRNGFFSGGGGGGSNDLELNRWITMHMTPLKDRDNGSYAFVAIFS
ncbi:hypothetical protein IE53DRAFT_383399 [Violaceomyces palustris]|uniref:Uncharacterized protein n=1 Tax=Violaceomyces palustris TaxID=1673888 RepID=A0ACD0P7G5_9BASI|nr:hypothetical protein IE53DRAFT_383399 [Violaceomyces palustris]